MPTIRKELYEKLKATADAAGGVLPYKIITENRKCGCIVGIAGVADGLKPDGSDEMVWRFANSPSVFELMEAFGFDSYIKLESESDMACLLSNGRYHDRRTPFSEWARLMDLHPSES